MCSTLCCTCNVSSGSRVAARGSRPGHCCPASLLELGINLHPPKKKKKKGPKTGYYFTPKISLKKKKATYKSASARVLLDLRDSPNARLVNGSTASNPKSQNQDERLRSLYLPTRSERLRDCSLGRGVADGGGSRGFLSYKAGLTICLGGV